MYSLPKEIAEGETHNLVLVLQHAHKCSLQEATERAAEMIEQETRRFIKTSQQIPNFSPELDRDVQAYVSNLQSILCGNLEWSRQTGRYASEMMMSQAKG